MDRKKETLSLFHPLIGRWFAERLGRPAEIQGLAWPLIAAGKHALITGAADPLDRRRDCLKDEFDLLHLRGLLDEVREGRIRVSKATTTTASPFCDGLIWKQTNTHMYEDDTPAPAKTSGLGEELIREALLSASASRTARNSYHSSFCFSISLSK